ncbi:hypothetical protein OROGR_020998 [Orobanche gracilis]
MDLGEKDWLACCGSLKFAQEMVSAGPFLNYQEALEAAKDIWFNKVDVNGWLEAFAAHPQIGETPSKTHKSPTSAHAKSRLYNAFYEETKKLILELLLISMRSLRTCGAAIICNVEKNKASFAHIHTIGGAKESNPLLRLLLMTLHYSELYDWNARYLQKFGFVFLIFASGRSTPEILAQMKQRYENRPIVEFEIAAEEQMKITELRLSKLFSANMKTTLATTDALTKSGGELFEVQDRVSIIRGHLTSKPETQTAFTRTRPPITTHVLDIARGSPAAGVDVRLDMWQNNNNNGSRPLFGQTTDSGLWMLRGCSITDKDGRSGPLMSAADDELNPGVYRISFDTGKYNPEGFFPCASVVFEVRESQKREHFHIPLLLSPFSFSTYRGS